MSFVYAETGYEKLRNRSGYRMRQFPQEKEEQEQKLTMSFFKEEGKGRSREEEVSRAEKARAILWSAPDGGRQTEDLPRKTDILIRVLLKIPWRRRGLNIN